MLSGGQYMVMVLCNYFMDQVFILFLCGLRLGQPAMHPAGKIMLSSILAANRRSLN